MLFNNACGGCRDIASGTPLIVFRTNISVISNQLNPTVKQLNSAQDSTDLSMIHFNQSAADIHRPGNLFVGPHHGFRLTPSLMVNSAQNRVIIRQD